MAAPPPLLLDSHPTLAVGRRYAEATLLQLRERFAQASPAFEQLVTVALGGSLGRLEAHPESDLDCILIARPLADPRALEQDLERALQLLDAIKLKPAKTSGIYRTAVSAAALTAADQHGSLTEPAEVFGKRMQLLLDARPVLHAPAFVALQAAVLDWYGAYFQSVDPRRGWTSLSNDLCRYLHAYAGWQQFKFTSDSEDSWHLRQAKLRSSRLITFAGLMFLLGHSNTRADKRDWLLERLRLTPMERLAAIMCRYDAAAFRRLLDAYECTQAALADPLQRSALVRNGNAPGSVGNSAASRRVVEAERNVSSILTAFLLARSADWDPRFFERLMF